MKKYIHRLRRWMCFLRQTAHNLVTDFLPLAYNQALGQWFSAYKNPLNRCTRFSGFSFEITW